MSAIGKFQMTERMNTKQRNRTMIHATKH